jgi:hypothetical protein
LRAQIIALVRSNAARSNAPDDRMSATVAAPPGQV